MPGSLFFMLVSVLIVGVILVLFVTFGRKSTPRLDTQKYQSSWLAIENSLQRDNPSSYHLAVLEADKLVDQALRELHLRGENMGERMKSAQKIWKHANNVWSAHKVRNRLAHETGAKLGHDEAMKALSAFKQALKDLGAI